MNRTHSLRQWLADNPRHPDADACQRELDRLERAEGLRTSILREGQERIDEPQYAEARAVPLAHSIASAFGREIPPAVRVFEGYAPVHFQWMKPDGKGGLVPAKKGKQ